jgi:PmbA protein
MKGEGVERSAIDDLLRRSFDQYELALVRETSRKHEVRDRELYGVDMKTEEGMSLRAVREGRRVFAYTFTAGEEGIKVLAAKANELLPFMERDEGIGFPAPSGVIPSMALFDEEGLRGPDNEKVAKLLDMEARILGCDRRIRKTRNCEYSEAEVVVRIVNSQGVDVQAGKSIFTAFGLAVAGDGGDDEVSYWDWTWSDSFEGLDFAALGEAIAHKTLASLGGAPLPTGAYEGILTPRAAADLLQVLSASFLGENLYKKKTSLLDKEGQEVFSPLVTIVDSGLAGIDAFPFDGEGVPSRETRIVEGGIFTGFLYDGYYGAKFGRPSTGNAVRAGVTAPPQNGVRGIHIVPGERDVAGTMSDGIIIDDLMGVHTANPITGEFSLGATGWMRRAGADRPFNGVVFSGNIFKLLKSLKAVGNDLRFFGAAGSPSLYIEGLTISGT